MEEGDEEGEEGEEEPSEGALPLVGWLLFILSVAGLVTAWRKVSREARAHTFHHNRIPLVEDDLEYVRVRGSGLS